MKLTFFQCNLGDELARERTQSYGLSQLHELTRANQLAAARRYLSSYPSHINYRDANGATAINIAAQINSTELFLQLASHPEVDLNIADLDGNTALYWARKNQNNEIIDYIINNSPEPHQEKIFQP